MRTSKNKLILTVLVVLALTLSSNPINHMVPFSVASGGLDFSISAYYDINYCEDYITLSARVRSQSASVPQMVLAEFDGQNITMKAPRMKLNFEMNGPDTIRGIYYYAFIKNPTIGIHNLTIYAGNSSGYNSSSKVSIEYNKTKEFENYYWSLDHYFIAQNTVLFIVNTGILRKDCVSGCFLEINGSKTEMQFDPELKYITWYYIRDFGNSTEERTIVYNATIVSSIGNLTKPASSFAIYPTPLTEFSSMSSSINVDKYTDDGLQISINSFYINTQNKDPQGRLIEINGVNHTASLLPNYQEDYGTSAVLWKYKMFHQGELLEPFVYTLEYATTYNISVWFFNGTWNKQNLWINQNTGLKPNKLTPPTVEFSNFNYYFEGKNIKVNGTVKITSTVPNFQLIDNQEFYGSVSIPYRGASFLFQETDNTDTDFSDGKIYFGQGTLLEANEITWGTIIIRSTIRFGNDSNSLLLESNSLLISTTINRTDGGELKFGVKGNESLLYTHTFKRRCCTELKAYMVNHYEFNVSEIGHKDGSDYMLVSARELEKKINSTGNGTFEGWSDVYFFDANYKYLSIESESTLLDFVVPLDFPAKWAEMINNLPFGTEKVSFQTDIFTGMMTMSYSESIEDIRWTYEARWDSRGILVSKIMRIYLGKELVYEELLTLDGFQEPVNVGLILIVIGAIVLIGVGIWVFKKKFPQFKLKKTPIAPK